MTISLVQWLMLGAILFAIGLIGFLTRRNLILLFLSLELMLAGVAVNAIAFARHHGNYDGHVFVLVILTIAASEAALGLSLVVALNRYRQSLDLNLWQDLGENQRAAETGEMPPSILDEHPVFPKLTPAGLSPLDRPLPQDVSSHQPKA